MTSAYASVQQWHHANAVHLACKADLFDQRPSLVVVRSNVVEVYAVVDDRPLRLRHRLVLQGTPVDVKPARFPGSQRDSLLLTFMDALLSRLDFNPETNRFETTAMHAYEMPKRKLGGVNDFQPPLLCVDPQQRCSAYVVASDSIMIWPFTDRVEFGAVHVTSDAPKGVVSQHGVETRAGLVVDLSEYGVDRIKAITFLNGFLEPSVLVLHDPEHTWAGRTAAKPSTCVLTSISISLDTGKHWLIANEKGLPYDAESLLALPMPVGGALVFSSNLVMYHKQKMEAALSVNEFGDRVTTLRVSPTQPTHCAPFCMERAAVAALAPDAFVIGTRAGDLHLLTLQTLGDSIRSMDVTRVTRSHIASCLCALSPSLLFIGSKLGDSLLVRYETTTVEVDVSSGAPDGDRQPDRDDAAMDILFRETPGADRRVVPTLSATVRDSLFCVAPLTRIRMTQSGTPARAEMVACSGYDRTGALLVLDDCVRPTQLASFDIKQPATGCWSLLADDDALYPTFVVIGQESRTLVRRSTGDELLTVDQSGFCTEEATVAAGNVAGRERIVQVLRRSVRLLRADTTATLIAEIAVDGVVQSAHVCDPFVALLLDDGSLLFGDAAAPALTLERVPRDTAPVAIALYRDRGTSGLFSARSMADPQASAGLLCNEVGGADDDDAPVAAADEEQQQRVRFLLVDTLCDDDLARPVLIAALANDDILIYNAFPSPAGHAPVPLAWSRFDHGRLTRPLMASGVVSTAPFAVKFDAIAGRSGVFVGGVRPCTLRVCTLPDGVAYEGGMAVRRKPLRATPILLTFHVDSGMVALLTLRKAPVWSVEEVTARSVPVQDNRCALHLCRNGSFDIVDTFDEMEHDGEETILAVEDAPLAVGGAADGKRIPFLAVGTANVESEEVQCRGRILLFRVHDTTPSDATGAGMRLNLAFESKEIGPISAIAAVQGCLCVAVGLRVVMYRWDADRLVGCAFFDADFYAVSLAAAKGFIVLADVYNSAYLLYWEPRLKQVMLLGRDPVYTEVYAADFLIDGDDLSVVVADAHGNLRLVGYAPYRPDSLGGRRLLRRADIHLGTRVTSFVRLRGRDLSGMTVSRGGRYPLVGAGIDGSVSCLAPVTETLYRRLYSLTTLLTFQVRHLGGLNPRQYRAWKAAGRGDILTTNCVRNVVDIDFLLRFAGLDYALQGQLAQSIGTTPDQIVDNLLQLQLSSSMQPYLA
ncbi:hypothetical protein PBRA_007432 [Plasmodiophora brassicae]|uniref:Cleavage/polyadenylation specificity factor A subunit C-terminal domain-containing protein n=1 Tax=Plasmodiophora brassicae TaxID=37360 RepID=A0A0G4IX65_PLABS|nr:hypothetical protein PBRA_007432 [Plasmodiophora brassicae]